MSANGPNGVPGRGTRPRDVVGADGSSWPDDARQRRNGDLTAALDELVERVAARAAEMVVERQQPQAVEPYLSVAEAASYLACKPKRIYDLTSQRRVPFVKDGARLLLRRADLDAYLEAQR
jgi:excisionase family DNA binding protein